MSGIQIMGGWCIATAGGAKPRSCAKRAAACQSDTLGTALSCCTQFSQTTTALTILPNQGGLIVAASGSLKMGTGCTSQPTTGGGLLHQPPGVYEAAIIPCWITLPMSLTMNVWWQPRSRYALSSLHCPRLSQQSQQGNSPFRWSRTMFG